ncbi:hypothetical protein [Dietzia sp. 179-F 9C3 NHS]|uniref:hypothetical protein n=1 Tax=Dietzia sp. 179-F 9C3 NHS TaxID=3374295 RepID=UPI00387976F8
MDPLFAIDLAAAAPPDDGGLFAASLATTGPRDPLGQAGHLVRFRHPGVGGTVTGTLFGPGPREATLAVTYDGALHLVDTRTWTRTH